ncbi:DUF3073 domain-containing protein [Marinitenerispora sediminis]|uniref:DUF3073 domain-containing protein n=1 Tax=Marinitenerispora sediminis TaxID=1931232 RepID=A0A368T795_9ACTN|nr:DUF3073 domain-containing protein [Marinitenerispora sediminis]RCV53007.1 DUF3073 domain-containing protein [Marinitenerispora sediminis]RCV57210.1 DUF3073 domain-containing protein [Marinitenerispora sediminis]RCV57253.1 DUF3073 domain-containing protein [Marinitenerispora sediminis]
MGRGRAKAKQQRVARRLKYRAGGTDLDRLRAELGVAEDNVSSEEPAGASDGAYEDPYDDLVDRYADYADKYVGGDAMGDTGDDSERSDRLR